MAVVTGGAIGNRADSWSLPEPLRAIESANGQFVLHLVAGGLRAGTPRCEGIVFERGTNTPDRELARFQLENLEAPVEAYITDDGQHVVALDNWHSVGLGDHVVAFYSRRGLVKKYSLEEALAGVGGLPNDPEQLRLWDQFRHSVSSRHWRDTEMVFLAGEADQARFAIWLAWAREWLVWRCHDGVSVRTDPDEVRPWEEYGRRWALARLEVPPVTNRPAPEILRLWNEEAIAWSIRKAERYQERIQACQYLATLRRSADRPLLEALLQDLEEEANWVPLLRIQADIALAFWDGLVTDVRTPEYGLPSLETKLHRLGHLRVDVEQPLPVSEDQGQVYFSLLPETVTESDWRAAPPKLRTAAGFTGSEPQQGQEHPPLHFPGMPPGRYWIKAVWKLTPPFDEELRLAADVREQSTSGTPASPTGPDYMESRGREVFEVRPGKVTTVRISFQ